MPPIKKRISNVVAWLGFTFMPPMIFLLAALPIAILNVTKVLENTPPYDCNRCYFLTREDINSSENLRRLDARVGDWVYTDENTLQRQKPLFFTKITEGLGEFFWATEDYWGFTIFFHSFFWLFCIIANYILVGSVRILPWKNFEKS